MRLLQVRVLAASDADKQARQRRELMNGGGVARSMIIAELKTGDYVVLGQGMNVDRMALAMIAASEGLALAAPDKEAIALRPGGIGVSLDPDTSATIGKRIEAQHKTAPDGTLIPPGGETFMRCGECHSPGFYATVRDGFPTALGRLVCARCGNEISMRAGFAQGGHA